MLSNHIILCCWLLHLPSIFPRIRVFSNESVLPITWPKYYNYSFSISLSMDTHGWIPYDWLVWSLWCPRDSQNSSPALQLKKTSIIWHSNFFMVQNSHLHMTTRKIIALTIWTFVSKVISLLFNTLPRSGIISFQAKCLCFVLFFFNYMAALTVYSDFGAQENKICHCFQFLSIYLLWSDRTRCHDLRFLNVEFQASFFTFLFHAHQESL